LEELECESSDFESAAVDRKLARLKQDRLSNVIDQLDMLHRSTSMIQRTTESLETQLANRQAPDSPRPQPAPISPSASSLAAVVTPKLTPFPPLQSWKKSGLVQVLISVTVYNEQPDEIADSMYGICRNVEDMLGYESGT
jgi:hypothetical protein